MTPTEEAIAAEQAAVSNTKWLAEVLAEAAGPIWHWGDGHGGYVIQLLMDARRELTGGAS